MLLDISLVLAQDYESEGQEDLPTVSPKAKESQVTNFFKESRATQNFFNNVNLSSNSMFTSKGLGNPDLSMPVDESQNVESTNSLDQKAKDEGSSWDARQPIKQETIKQEKVEEAPKIEAKSEDEEAASPVLPSNLGQINLNGEVDPNMKSVLEQSQKIREAIFGSKASEKLTVPVQEKIGTRENKDTSGSTRF